MIKNDSSTGLRGFSDADRESPILTRFKRKARLLALYLPQFHPTPENDEWWGKGFTEWTNVARARPLFRGHYQPRVPADLGFYDLRVPETRIAQAEMARAHGIEAFCYWHYWFAGRRILGRPFEEVLQSGEPDFPFCLAWANHTWTGTWYGEPNRILIEQTYPGMADHEAHFRYLLRAFSDPRYVTVEGKPIFFVFQPLELPDAKKVTDFWRTLAEREGLKGLHLVAIDARNCTLDWRPQDYGFDAVSMQSMPPGFPDWSRPIRRTIWTLQGHPRTKHLARKVLPMQVRSFPYAKALEHFSKNRAQDCEDYPCVIPNWDNSPRSGHAALVLEGSTPELFRSHLREAIGRVQDLPPERRIIIAKSWNEWAEGNHLEPDKTHGLGYLNVVKDEVFDFASATKK